MEYNLHPIFVHFPIALLTLYAVIKVLPIQKWLPNFASKHVERVLLLTGFIGALVALATGEEASEMVLVSHDLVEVHEFFADLATWIFGALLAGEILSIFSYKIPSALVSLGKLLTNGVLSKFLAIVGLVAITITGLLGGVMVYGTTADPMANIVLQLLGISI